MKNFKKLLSLLLALAMLTGILAGCSDKDEQGDGGKWGDEQTTTGATEPVVYDSHYYFYDYNTQEYLASDVATYQAVTGAVCELSSLDWTFLEGDYTYVVEGYDDRYGVFLYAYDESQLEQYRHYLASVGFVFSGKESYTDGESLYFKNQSNNYTVDLFVAADGSYVAIEPCVEADESLPVNTEATEPAETEAPATEAGSYDSFYYFYDYETGEYVASEVATYQAVTGAACEYSVLDFGFLTEEDYQYVTAGYDEEYGVFLYPYNEDTLDVYKDYLNSMGYHCINTGKYTEGTSYYFENLEGYTFDLFILADMSYLAIEPYLNGEMQ